MGKSIIAPAIQDDVEIQKFNALTAPRLFNKVLTSINGKPIPVEDIFKNELVRVHNVQEKDKDSCYNSILKNITELNFYKENNGKKYVMLPTPSSNMMSSDVDDENSMLYENEFDGDEINESSQNKSIRKQIFVAHGKDHKPLEQLKTILDQFKVPYKVAIDESNQGRPISQKVSDLMRECSSAIFLFTKDEKTTDKEGNVLYRPSDNVVFELGAASVLYGNKIVIFKQNDVSFGSDFKDLGYISFEDEQLNTKTVDLMKELIDLGLLTVNPT